MSRAERLASATEPRRYTRVVLPIALLTTLCCACRGSEPAAAPFQPALRLQTLRTSSTGTNDLELVADQGTPAEAAAYARHIERAIGFPASGSLDALLVYCGYSALTGKYLETGSPDTLMDGASGRLLALRFLAPGISDLSTVGGPPATKDIGWRKLVRLFVDPASPGGMRGIGSVFVLFNVFQPRSELSRDPFASCEQNPKRCAASVQVILVPRAHQSGSDAVYWLAFDSSAEGYRRTDHLSAVIDGGDQASRTDGSPEKPHYLPAACAQCHGASAAEGRLNYLDSDYWNDRIQPGDDFEDIGVRSSNGVLFDGGRDTTSPEFVRAFDVLTRLNEEIRSQNAATVRPGFALRAVEHWLDLHASRPGFADPVSRALPPLPERPAARVWQDTPEDRALLNHLNRYCSRCHNTVSFHMLDKEAVFQRKDAMARRVEAGALRPGGMPLDRVLDPPAVRELSARLRALR